MPNQNGGRATPKLANVVMTLSTQVPLLTPDSKPNKIPRKALKMKANIPKCTVTGRRRPIIVITGSL